MGRFVNVVTVASTKKRSEKFSEPVFILTPTKNKIKINAPASKAMLIGNRDNIVLVNNFNPENPIADKDLDWGIVKGWAFVDDAGEPILVPDRITDSEAKKLIEDGQSEEVDGKIRAIAPEVPKMRGSRMSVINTIASKGAIGYTLEGTDSNNWSKLGGDKDSNVVFKILIDEVEYEEIDNEERAIYPIEFMTKSTKIIKGTGDSDGTNDGDDNPAMKETDM